MRWVILGLLLWSFPVKAETLRDEMKGLSAFEKGAYAEAAEALHDPYRRGIAYYRAGEYGKALEMFKEVKERGQEAVFNSGNSYFQMKDYAKAVAAYKAVLEKQPEHEDAAHNLALAEAMMKQNNKGNSSDRNKQDQGKGEGQGQSGAPQDQKQEAPKEKESKSEAESQQKAEEGAQQEQRGTQKKTLPSRSDATLERMLQQMQTDPSDIIKKRIEQQEYNAIQRDPGVMRNAAPW